MRQIAASTIQQLGTQICQENNDHSKGSKIQDWNFPSKSRTGLKYFMK